MARLLVSIVIATLVIDVQAGWAQKKPKSTPVIDSLERRVVADSNDAIIHYELAMAYWSVKRLDDAERELREAVKLAPQYAEAYLALSAIPLAREEKYWKKIEKEQGKSAVQAAYDASGRFYRKAFLLNPLVDLQVLGKVEKPFEIHNKIELEDGTVISFEAWWLQPLSRSLKAFYGANYEKAFDLLQKLLEDERSGTDGMHLPGVVIWYHGLTAAALRRYDIAIHDFAILTGRAIADEKADPVTVLPLMANDYRYVLATMLYLAGRYDQAAPTFRRALEFDVGLYPAHVQLARMLEAQGRWEEAIAERQAAVNANPDDAVLHTDLGQTLLRAGKLEEAAQAFEVAMATNPRDPYPQYLAGIVALRLNRRTEARAAFTRFLALAPSRYAAQIVEVREQLPLLESSP